MALQPIQPLRGPNLGGLLGCMRLFPVGNLIAPPIVRGNQVLGELALLDVANYCDVWFTPGTGQLVEEADRTEQGLLYRQKLTAEVPRDAPDVADALEQLLQLREFVVLCQDHNGYTRLLGSPAWPLRFSQQLDTGRGLRETSHRTLQLAADNPVPAAFYQHFQIPEGGSRRAFSAGFSFGFGS